jgi:hypothetical protein
LGLVSVNIVLRLAGLASPLSSPPSAEDRGKVKIMADKLATVAPLVVFVCRVISVSRPFPNLSEGVPRQGPLEQGIGR